MKTHIFFLAFVGSSIAFHPLSAQTDKCYDFDCMMEKAKAYFENGKYQDAINSATAAKRYPGAKEYEADALIKEVFNEIDQLRTQAERATHEAENANKIAQKSREEAENQKENAERLKDEANAHLESERKARERVEELIQKGKVLETTFSDTSTYEYLYRTGLKYFQWDQIEQRRDYRNALTYFALAGFLKPSDTLNCLVEAAKSGIEAEADFINGHLVDATARYETIKSNLDKTSQNAGFEDWRMQQIRTVDSLYKEFTLKYDSLTYNGDTLFGDWWTLPADFQHYKSISALYFKNNPATFREFPAVLGALPQLDTVAFINCTAIRVLSDWDCFPELKILTLHDNLNIVSLEGLGALNRLIVLDIENCPALARVEGDVRLEHLTVKMSPQVRLSEVLQSNYVLKSLELADIPGQTLNTGNLTALESLSLSRMMLQSLEGIDKNSRLHLLKMDRMVHLKAIAPPAHLAAAYITNCQQLESLSNWPPSDSLEILVLLGNDSLKALPRWQQLPNLQHLLVQNNENIRFIKGTQALKKAEKIFLLNNRDVATNSIHAGFGYEWGPELSSVKLEYEHRRTLKWLKSQDFGIKFVAAFTKKVFDNDALFVQRETQGFIGGVVINYYSPYRLYGGLGVGVGQIQNIYRDDPRQYKFTTVWINNVGIQFAPPFLRKDKVSLNIDLYTIFDENDYFILPSFGITYYHTLGFHRKTSFLRPGDSRRYIYMGWDREPVDRVLERF